MTFNELWNRIEQDWPVTPIEHWRVTGGHTGHHFVIMDVEPDHMVVRPAAGNPNQRIPKRDFHALFAIWSAYTAGDIRRGDLRLTTRSARYVISVFHWFEETQQEIQDSLRPSPTGSPVKPETSPHRGA